MAKKMKKPDSCFLPNYSSNEISKLDKENSIVLLPLASIEQHGPHLPIFTDSLIAEAVLQRVLERIPEGFPLWYLPLLPYAKSNEHVGFPGTITLSAETLIRVLTEIAHSLVKTGFKKFVILNTHGGNGELVDIVIRDIREKFDLMAFGLHIFLRIGVPSEGLSEDEKRFGIHAGDVETSILLEISPSLVNWDLAPNAIPLHLKDMDTQPFLGPMNFAWLTKDIAPEGVLGNAQTAEADRGALYLDQAAQETADLLEQILTFEFAKDT